MLGLNREDKMTICKLCDINPAQDCKRCGFSLPVCAECVAADDWLRCGACRIMNRRRVIKLAGALGSMLVVGFVQGIPWRGIDFVRPRQNASIPKRHRIGAVAISHSWRASVAIGKR